MSSLKIGVINWDGCPNSDTTYFGTYSAKSLSNPKYADRVPFYADRAKDGTISFHDRTQEEFDEKHILNAICIPNETIGTEPPAELPDKEQLILVYCRSGNRSKQASEKLAAMGYTNIKEFGGINTWTGATVSHSE